MRRLVLNCGKIAMIDKEDFERVSEFKWYFSPPYYAVRNAVINNRKKTVGLHREILNFPKDIVDHINGDGLDNRKINLRTCSIAQNSRNRHIYLGRSKFKGVSWKTCKNKWVTRIGLNYKRIHIGYFTTEQEAAKAYDLKAKELFGEFAKTNGAL